MSNCRWLLSPLSPLSQVCFHPIVTLGKPKAVLHTTAGYAVGAAATFKYVFDYKDTDIYWWVPGMAVKIHTCEIYRWLTGGLTLGSSTHLPCQDSSPTHFPLLAYHHPGALRTVDGSLVTLT